MSRKQGRVTLNAVIKELMKDPALSEETKQDLWRWLRNAKAKQRRRQVKKYSQKEWAEYVRSVVYGKQKV